MEDLKMENTDTITSKQIAEDLEMKTLTPLMIALQYQKDPGVIVSVIENSSAEAFSETNANGWNALMYALRYQTDPGVIARVIEKSSSEAFSVKAADDNLKSSGALCSRVSPSDKKSKEIRKQNREMTRRRINDLIDSVMHRHPEIFIARLPDPSRDTPSYLDHRW
jgi:hypothetical protein